MSKKNRPKLYVVAYYLNDGEKRVWKHIFDTKDEAKEATNCNPSIPDGARVEIGEISHPRLSLEEMRVKIHELFDAQP